MSAKKLRVGLVGGSLMFPAAAQKREVEAAGVDRIYVLSAGETVENLITGIRNVETLVVPGLYSFRCRRKELVDVLTRLALKHITVERARDGLTMPVAAVAWAVDDLGAMAGEARLKSKAEARKRGSKGGRPPMDKPMTDEAFMRVWRRRKPATERAAAAGISLRAAYRWAEKIKRERQNSGEQ